jgi:hypothetical protein
VGGIPLAVLPARPTTIGDGLLAATLDAAATVTVEAVGPLPGTLTVHVVEFWLALASAVLVCGRLLRRAWTHFRWQGRPRCRP